MLKDFPPWKVWTEEEWDKYCIHKSNAALYNAALDTISPLATQVGGTHYKEMKIQPIEFIQANDLGFEEGNAIKYICRYKSKNGIQDLEKALHYIQLLIDKEKRRAEQN